jgi:hypothetical protein
LIDGARVIQQTDGLAVDVRQDIQIKLRGWQLGMLVFNFLFSNA